MLVQVNNICAIVYRISHCLFIAYPEYRIMVYLYDRMHGIPAAQHCCQTVQHGTEPLAPCATQHWPVFFVWGIHPRRSLRWPWQQGRARRKCETHTHTYSGLPHLIFERRKAEDNPSCTHTHKQTHNITQQSPSPLSSFLSIPHLSERLPWYHYGLSWLSLSISILCFRESTYGFTFIHYIHNVIVE